MATIYPDGKDFKHGGDSCCSLRSLQLLVVCVHSEHLVQSFGKKKFSCINALLQAAGKGQKMEYGVQKALARE